jgi:hypothetical protein
MHPVSNQVPVPIDQIEHELLAIAKRRFTGEVRLSLRVKPEAALSGEIGPCARRMCSQDRRRPSGICW